MQTCLLLCCLVAHVTAFTFPADWEKIRQRMKERQAMEVGVRFFGGDEYPEEEEEASSPNVAPETVIQPIVLDPIMKEVMNIANFTEIEIRFGNSQLIGRNSFELSTRPVFSVSESVWNFTNSLINTGLYDSSTGNSLFSPVSILTTINMLLLGTRGHTRDQIITALGYPRYTGHVHAMFNQTLYSINNDIGVTVSTSNAIFCQANLALKSSFTDDLKLYYGNSVDIVHLDFTRRPKTTMRIMNRFIGVKTNNLIENMFTQPVAADSKMVLTNALYFNGSWEYEFLLSPPEYTGIPAKFNSFNKQIDITLMTASLDLPFLKDDQLGMVIASLPYEHDVRNAELSESHMFLMQPIMEGEEAFLRMEQQLVDINWEDVFSRMSPVFGEIQVPRMRMEFQANLAPHLSALGMKNLFSGQGNSDFSPMSDTWQDFKFDTLQHKTVLKITETGTEAAAATSAFQFRMIPSTILQLDRPFFLFIYDALNKVVIFWCRVVEPEPLHMQ